MTKKELKVKLKRGFGKGSKIKIDRIIESNRYQVTLVLYRRISKNTAGERYVEYRSAAIPPEHSKYGGYDMIVGLERKNGKQ